MNNIIINNESYNNGKTRIRYVNNFIWNSNIHVYNG